MSITITATTPTDIRYFPEADDVAQAHDRAIH
jgi:hypothetical protein